MDAPDAAQAYARADFSDSNSAFVQELLARHPHLRTVVDLGCGPGDIPIRLARALRTVHVTAVDGSAAMLDLAREAVRAAGLTERVHLIQGRIPGLDLPEQAFDAVLSKDMLHHLPDPHVLWQEALRLAKPGGVICVMDLVRPDSPVAAREIVERVAGREHPLLKEDFYYSLCAAFTPSEVRAQLAAVGLTLAVEQIGDRHMRIHGVLHALAR